MSCESYIVGDEARFTASFVSASTGLAIDPTTVVFKVRTPLGIESEFTYGVDVELMRLATGSYALDVLFTEPSLPAAPGATPPQPFPRDWFVRFISEGNLVSAKEQRIKVRASNFVNPNPGGGAIPNAMTDNGEAMSDDGQPMIDTP